MRFTLKGFRVSGRLRVVSQGFLLLFTPDHVGGRRQQHEKRADAHQEQIAWPLTQDRAKCPEKLTCFPYPMRPASSCYHPIVEEQEEDPPELCAHQSESHPAPVKLPFPEP